VNTDMTAPPVVRNKQFGSTLSADTAEAALSRQAQLALDNFRQALWAAASVEQKWPAPGALAARNMTAITAMEVGTLDQMFAAHTSATYMSGALNITAVRSALRALETGGSFCETVSGAAARARNSTDAEPSTTIERFVRALGEWKGLLAPDHFDSMARHVRRLLSDQEELDEDKTVPSPSSFDDMLAFLSSRPWDKAPAVGLNRKGKFSVSWTRSHPHTDVTLTFLGEGSVKWYVYGLGRKSTGSATGTSDRLDLPGTLSGLRCDNWMAR
jgi:hypothetical protein